MLPPGRTGRRLIAPGHPGTLITRDTAVPFPGTATANLRRQRASGGVVLISRSAGRTASDIGMVSRMHSMR